MAQAKLTINGTQAKALGLLVYHKKTNPYTAIMFEPKSGVNLRQTRVGQSIEVLDSADISNLKNLQKAGYFTVIEGTILPHAATFSTISGGVSSVVLNFSGPVTAPALNATAAGAATDDIIFKINGVATVAHFGAVTGATTISAPMDFTNEDMSVQLTQTGASKILDANKSAVLPGTKTFSITPIFQDVTISGAGNAMLNLYFTEPMYTAGVSSTGLGQGTDDLIILVDSTAKAVTIGPILKAAATNVITVDLGADAPTTGISVTLTATGAAKIKDADDNAVAVPPQPRTYTLGTDTDITDFSFTEETGAATINATNHTIAIEVDYGTVVTALIPTFTLSKGATAAIGATAQVSGVTANNYTAAVTYVITPQVGVAQNWTVTTTVRAAETGTDFLTYNFTDAANTALSADVTGTVNAVAHTVALTVPHGTVVTALIASFTVSPEATVTIGATGQDSGVTANDFTAAKTYNVYAEDTTWQAWTVTVTVAPA